MLHILFVQIASYLKTICGDKGRISTKDSGQHATHLSPQLTPQTPDQLTGDQHSMCVFVCVCLSMSAEEMTGQT